MVWRMKTLAGMALAACFLAAAGAERPVVPPDEFYLQARWIMSKSEQEIYAHLADAEARGEFIRDFWEKRDPTPGSAENEFRDDFTRRAAFAERWFRERGTTGGWESDRGRILLTLGFPDERRQLPMLDRPRARAAEVWIYSSLGLALEFIDADGLGRFRLENWPLELLDAIERVKELGSPAGAGRFRFQVRRDPAGLRIEIPVKGVVVEERGTEVRAAFAVAVDVYRDFAKLERISFSREFVEERGAFTRRRRFEIAVPYSGAAPGNYLFDVTVREQTSGERFRDHASFRKKR